MSDKIGDILVLDREQREVISYGLSVLAGNIIGLAGVLLIAYLLGALRPTMVMSFVLLMLRPGAGGAHCNTTVNCSLFGYVFLPLFGYGAFWLSHCPVHIQSISLLSCALPGFIYIALKAPYFTQSKPRAEEKNRILKTRALVMATAAFLAALIFLIVARYEWSMGIAAGLLFQGLVLSPLGVKDISYLDMLLSRITLKRR